eukprot:6707416-Prymnesium_polylepis.1
MKMRTYVGATRIQVSEGWISFSQLVGSLRWVIKSRRTTLVRGKEIVCRTDKQFRDKIGEAFKANASRIVDLFHEYDINRDGVLQKDEFKRALPMLGLMISSDEADKLFDWYDEDHSGELTLEEFTRILRNERQKKDEGPVVVEEEWADLRNLRADVQASFHDFLSYDFHTKGDP